MAGRGGGVLDGDQKPYGVVEEVDRWQEHEDVAVALLDGKVALWKADEWAFVELWDECALGCLQAGLP